jgi:hypothetical protein
MVTTLAEWLATGELAHFAKLNDWAVKSYAEKPGMFRITMDAKDGAVYHLRADWSSCPAAPSVVFCDENLKKEVPSAWPIGTSLFMDYVKPPTNCFLCCPYTKEGFEHHAEWLQHVGPRWRISESTLVDTLLFIQGLLHGPTYTGRMAA